MKEIETLMQSLAKGDVSGIFPTEGVILDSVRELVRDEIKRYIQAKLEENQELKDEIKDAVKEYIEAKAKEVHATLKLAKAGAKLGLSLIPEDMQKEMSKEFISLFEKELGEIIAKAV